MDPTLQAISKQTEIPVSEIPSPKTRHPFHKTPIVLMSLFVLLVVGAFFAGTYYQGMSKTSDVRQVATLTPPSPQPSPTPDIARNWLTYTSTSGFSFQYPPEYQIEKEGITNGKFTVSLKHKNYNDSKEAWGTSRAEVRKFDVSSQKLKGTLEEYIIQVFRLKVFKLGEFDGYELSKDPKDMTVFAIAEEKYGDNKWAHVIVPGIDDNFYYLLSPEGVLASTYNGYGAFIPSEVFDQILKTFTFLDTTETNSALN